MVCDAFTPRSSRQLKFVYKAKYNLEQAETRFTKLKNMSARCRARKSWNHLLEIGQNIDVHSYNKYLNIFYLERPVGLLIKNVGQKMFFEYERDLALYTHARVWEINRSGCNQVTAQAETARVFLYSDSPEVNKPDLTILDEHVWSRI